MGAPWTSGLDGLTDALPHVDPARVRIRTSSRLLPFVARFVLPGARAMTLPWGIYLHPQTTTDGLPSLRLVAHELVHLEQWRRLGVVGFLTSYLGDYVRARRAGQSHIEAYGSIGLEQEAVATARLAGGMS